MPIIQDIDRKRFKQQNPIYRGRGLIQSKTLPFISLNNHNLYFSRTGGFLDMSTLINAAKTGLDFVRDNKELINQGISTVGVVKDTANAFSNTMKSYKELENIKQAQKERKKQVKREEYTMNPEQLDKLAKIGTGFAKF
jgi:hypothetical protein